MSNAPIYQNNCYFRNTEGNLQEAKLELIQWLAAIDDPSIIEQIQAIRNKEKDDWWERVLAIDRELFGEGTEDDDG